MTRYTYCLDVFKTIKDEVIELGDLVQTVLGEYGVVVGLGPHSIFYNDKSNYFKVLIKGYVYHYISGSLRKVNKKLDK